MKISEAIEKERSAQLAAVAIPTRYMKEQLAKAKVNTDNVVAEAEELLWQYADLQR